MAGTLEEQLFQAVQDAARHRSADQVIQLLDQGADPSVLHPVFKTTPVHLAAELIIVDCCKALLEHGVDPNIMNAEGCTPLDSALDLHLHGKGDPWAQAEAMIGAQQVAVAKQQLLQLVNLFRDKGATVPEEKVQRLGLGKGTGCFIATVCYGSAECREVVRLCRLRDDVLLQSSVGRFLVTCYYRVSPALAEWIRDRPKCASLVRKCLIQPVANQLSDVE